MPSKMGVARSFRARVESIRIRLDALSSLRKMVALPPECDISDRQWRVLESQLASAQSRILSDVKRAAGEYLPQINDVRQARKCNAALGEIEMDLSRSFTFFDTYMDVLTQRRTPELGPTLAGCDVLAWDAINKDHPALVVIEPPLVFCDRGFGASILREDVPLPDLTPNPMPLIQIPYSRLKEKYNLTSVLHEVGHQAIVRLGLQPVVPRALRLALARAGASEPIQDLYALWASEIGPDFWAFCAAGMAQSASIKEILALPPNHVFRVSWTDPHPPPYVRVLLSFEWCRQMWGRGDWDDWTEEWAALYPLEQVADGSRRLFQQLQQYLPVVGRTLLTTKFEVLNGRTIAELFDLSKLAPVELKRAAGAAGSGDLPVDRLTPCIQLAVFRVLRDHGKVGTDSLDRLMTRWLVELGKQRNLNM